MRLRLYVRAASWEATISAARPAVFGRAQRHEHRGGVGHSTVTDLARLRGWSTSVPFRIAVW